MVIIIIVKNMIISVSTRSPIKPGRPLTQGNPVKAELKADEREVTEQELISIREHEHEEKMLKQAIALSLKGAEEHVKVEEDNNQQYAEEEEEELMLRRAIALSLQEREK